MTSQDAFMHNWRIVKFCTWIDGHYCQKCEMHTLYHCDVAYSIWPYLQKDYHNPNDVNKIKYVYNMNSRKVIIESVFGSLMNKWYTLKLFNSRVNRALRITITCCVYIIFVLIGVHLCLGLQMYQPFQIIFKDSEIDYQLL
jgi:hypothetical protein